MNRFMPMLALALSGCAATAPRLATFTDAVPVRLDFAEGACRFWYTDHGSNSSQLQRYLAGVANKSSRVEFWTDGPSHETCLLEGWLPPIARDLRLSLSVLWPVSTTWVTLLAKSAFDQLRT